MTGKKQNPWIVNKKTIHSTEGLGLNCSCDVEVECDYETISLNFPQLNQDDDVRPGVYAAVCGNTMSVTLSGHEGDDDVEYAWNAKDAKWHKVTRKSKPPA